MIIKNLVVIKMIRAILNSLFFLRKDFAHTKSTKALKALKALEAIDGTNTPGQKHKNANKRISDYLSP